MNLPNKLTVVRVLLIPVFLALFLLNGIPHNFLWALVVFGAASLTDMLDGKIARKQGLVTDFGVLMDPLADKLLVMAAMVCFVPAGLVHVLVVILILAREFLVTSIRLVAAGKGTVLAADRWGKMKTVSQMIWICSGLLLLWLQSAFSLSPALDRGLWITFYCLTGLVVFFTVFSGCNYVVKNRELFQDV